MTPTNRRVVFANPARADLRNHYQHLAQYDEDIARRTITDLITKIFDIAGKGLTGSRRSFAPDPVRAFPYKRHCYYFMVDNGTLTLLRVLAQSQDVDEIVFNPDKK